MGSPEHKHDGYDHNKRKHDAQNRGANLTVTSNQLQTLLFIFSQKNLRKESLK